MKMQTARSSETSAILYQTKLRNVQEDGIVSTYCSYNIKNHKV
jgi:hypothetical protein